MAASRPRRGPVVISQTRQPTTTTPRTTAERHHAGLWRPDKPFDSAYGLHILMRRENGVTKGDVLRVPFRFQVPVTGDFSRPYQFNWATYDTLRLGQRSRPMGQQLLQLQIDTMFLDEQTAHGSRGLVAWHHKPDPQAMIRELLWIMGKAKGSEPQVFRLVISQPAVWGATPLINMLASLTAMQPSQKAGEVGTEYLSATFLEYEEGDVSRKQRPKHHGATRHKLSPGDTLYEIAKHSHFHRPSAWKLIAKANGIKGVSAHSASELAAWAKRHHKTELKIPAVTWGADTAANAKLVGNQPLADGI